MGVWTRKPIESAHDGDGPRLRRPLGCTYLFMSLPPATQIRFLVWMALGPVIYGAMHLWRARRQAPAST